MLRLEVLCFAGTYGLALLSELARFVTRSAARWYLTVGLTALGWLVQTAYLADLSWSQHKVPVTTVFESLLVLSWILALIGLYLMVRSPQPVAVGLFVLPLVLALVLLAGRFASRTAQWDEWRGATALLGLGAWGVPPGRGGQHVRGVCRRPDVPGPVQSPQA